MNEGISICCCSNECEGNLSCHVKERKLCISLSISLRGAISLSISWSQLLMNEFLMKKKEAVAR